MEGIVEISMGAQEDAVGVSQGARSVEVLARCEAIWGVGCRRDGLVQGQGGRIGAQVFELTAPLGASRAAGQVSDVPSTAEERRVDDALASSVPKTLG